MQSKSHKPMKHSDNRKSVMNLSTGVIIRSFWIYAQDIRKIKLVFPQL